jgi:hypothetical protein
MPYTHSYLPPDSRALPPFDVVRGLDSTVKRVEFDVNYIGTDTDWSIIVGEPVRSVENIAGGDTDAFSISSTLFLATNGEIVGVGSAATRTEIDRPLGISFDKFSSTNNSAKGFPCANGRGKLAVLKQVFIGRLLAHAFISDVHEMENGTYPPGTPAEGGHGHDAAFLAACAAGPVVGAPVVMVKTLLEEPRYMALPMDYLIFTGDAISADNMALRLQIIGHIIKIQTVNGDDFVDVLFKF